MAKAARIRWYGLAAVLVVAGTLVIILSDTVTAEAVSVALISLGLIVLMSLMFFEVGLSEDKARAREDELRRAEAPAPAARRLAPTRRRRQRG
jgi:membrane protein implicated in regulation of membrane protease activity